MNWEDTTMDLHATANALVDSEVDVVGPGMAVQVLHDPVRMMLRNDFN